MKAKRKKRQSTVSSDFGPQERAQHGPLVLEAVAEGMEDTTQKDRVRAINTDDPLYRLCRQGSITARQKRAGYLLRELWTQAGGEPCVTAKYMEQIGHGSIVGAYVNGIDFRKKFDGIMERFTPNVFTALMICIQGERLPRHSVRYAKQGLIGLQRTFET